MGMEKQLKDYGDKVDEKDREAIAENIKKLKELIKLMVSNDLTELDLQGEGERVTLEVEEGLMHVWQIFPDVPEAQHAVERIGAFIARHC